MKDSTLQLMTIYIAATLNKNPEEWGVPRHVTGMDVVDALWSLNDLFRAHLDEVGKLPYESKHEAEADFAIEGFISHGEVAWNNLHNGVWRVLIERHFQALVAASVNDAAGNTSFMTIPSELPDSALLHVSMIYMLHGMKLPYPVKNRSADEFPQSDAPASRLLH